MENVNSFLGIGTLAGILGLLIVIVLQHRDKGNLVETLTDTLKEINVNAKALDLIEPLATKVVPASLVTQANRGADFLESFTPDEVDQLIEQFRTLLNKTTDGKPNNAQGNGDPSFVDKIGSQWPEGASPS